MRSAMVAILRPWSCAKRTRSGRRAMVPSSFMISQMTPEGLRPARRATSTAASVWPLRTRTPPSRAISGKMWPGVTRSSGPFVGSIAVAMVRARSGAEMPVVTPSRASIETVKAVRRREAFCCGISGRRSCSTRSRVRARQMRPRPCFAMKLMACGVAICAGMTRSPSSSRSSSSTRMNMRPLRASSMTSSMGDVTSMKLMTAPPLRPFASSLAAAPPRLDYRFPGARRKRAAPGLWARALEKAGDIARQHVDLEIDAVARPRRPEAGAALGVRDDVDAEDGALDLVDGQRHAVEGDRALGRDRARERRWRAEAEADGIAFRAALDDLGRPVDMAQHDMAAELVAEPQGAFEVDLHAGAPGADRRPRHGLGGGGGGEPVRPLLDDGEADPRAGDRGADRDLRHREMRGDDEPRVAPRIDPPDGAEIGDDAAEHGTRLCGRAPGFQNHIDSSPPLRERARQALRYAAFRRNSVSKPLTASGCSCWTQWPAPSTRRQNSIFVKARSCIRSKSPGFW